MDANVIHQDILEAFTVNKPFPEIVKTLAMTGVEWYYADLLKMEKTFYDAAGGTHLEKLPLQTMPVITQFSESGIRTALKAIQQGNTTYSEFLRDIMRAGCAAYTVHIQGRKAIYLGRQGDLYVEPFPSAN